MAIRKIYFYRTSQSVNIWTTVPLKPGAKLKTHAGTIVLGTNKELNGIPKSTETEGVKYQEFTYKLK